MKVVRSGEYYTCEQGIVSVGTFDGVHLAHQEIVRIMQEEQSRNGGTTGVITFDPHPQEVLHSRPHEVKLLTTIDERLALLERYGVDTAIIVQFSKEFSQTPPEQFVDEYLIRMLHATRVVVGHDHGFGKGRAGDLELLKTLGAQNNFSVHVVEPLIVNGAPVSSTRIRSALESGNVAQANELLGRAYSFHGTVVHGDGRGATIGYPTANIEMHAPNKLLPADGIYAVRVHRANETLHGAMSIGVRPTIGADLQRTIEVHILDFNQHLYDELLEIECVQRIRAEKKFDSLELLTQQIGRDTIEARRLLETT